MFRKIVAANLSSSKAEKSLATLLANNPQKKIFEAGTYQVPAPTAKNPQATRKVILKKMLVSYQSRKHPGAQRFAVCDKTSISKQHATKYYSKATIKAGTTADGEFHVVMKDQADKQRFVKLTNTADEDVKESIVRENRFLQEISLFGAKGLETEGDWTAQVMRRIEGRSLIHILIEDDKKNMFTVDQRLDLWAMAGEAVMQAHARGIIHRDVKADQFIVKLDAHNNPVQVVLGDYDRAKWKDEVVYECVGTSNAHVEESQRIDYRAPEVKANIWSDEKSDAYSFATLMIEYGWNDLFSETNERYRGLTDKHKLMMEEVMVRGIEEDAEKRASIEDMVSVFKTIRANRQHEMKGKLKGC